MSTGVLYRALGIRGDKHQSIREQGGGIVMRVRHAGGRIVCPSCGGANVVRRGTVPRSWSAPPIGSKPVTVFAEVPRIESKRLHEALKLNESLATAYYLKEDLRLLWEEPTQAAASRFLDDWIRQAESSGIRVLPTFARTPAIYRTGILVWYDHPISTGPLEGANNKIKTRWRQAYGFRDQDYFKLKIKSLHHSRLELVG